MATLEKIRSKATLLVIVVGIALLAFIVGDFLKSGSTFFHQKQENIVTVNGEALNYRDFQIKVEERSNLLKQNNNRTFTDDQQNQIRQGVLNEAIDDILFSEETKKLGLVVSKDEYRELLMGNNISPVVQQYFRDPQTGRFDRARLMQFLQMIESDDFTGYPEEYISQLMQQKKMWLDIETRVIQEQLRMKFSILVASAILTNNLEIQAQIDNNRTSVDFDFVSQSYNTIPDAEVSVSEAEIKQLYNERKNQYKQEEARVINYIAYPVDPSPEDYEVVENKLVNLKAQLSAENIAELVQFNSDADAPYVNAYRAYSDLSANVKQLVDANPVGLIEGPVLINDTYHLYKFEGEKMAPDSIKLYALMLPVFGSEDQLNHLADSLIQIVKSGTPFAEMASLASNGQTDGDMGWATETILASQVDVQFKDEVFNAPVNTPRVVKSSMSSFLIQVSEKTKPVKKYKVANVQVRVTPSQETKTRLYNELSQFVANNRSLTAWKENAGEAGFNVQEAEATKEQINIGNIQNTRQIIQWAFNNTKGAISNIYECQNGEYFVVATLEGTLSEGYRSLASVSTLLQRELLNKKKGEKLVADLKANNFTTLDQYAEVMNTTPQSVKFVTFATPVISGTIGAEPVLNAEAPFAPLNEVAGPFAGKNRVYAIMVTDKREDEVTDESQKQQTQMQNMSRAYQLVQSPELLRENAKIVNNFSRFF